MSAGLGFRWEMEIDVVTILDREPASKQNPNEFATRDLGLAAYLSIDRPLLGIQKEGPNQIVFQFMDDEKLRVDVNDYFALRGAVQPLRYAIAIRGMKNIVHQAMQAPRPTETQLATAGAGNEGGVPLTTTVRRRRVAT